MMRWIALLAVLVLAGCAGTSSNVRAPYSGSESDRFVYAIDNHGGMTPEAREILIARLRQQLGAALAPEGDQGANRITIRIDYYRMRNAASRLLVGVMAGQDRIQSSVTVTAPDGRTIGSVVVELEEPDRYVHFPWTHRGAVVAGTGVVGPALLGRPHGTVTAPR